MQWLLQGQLEIPGLGRCLSTWSPVFCINKSEQRSQSVGVSHCSAVREKGGSGVCCSSAVRRLQRCRERHAELPERSTFTRPGVYSAVGPSTHTQTQMWVQVLEKRTHICCCSCHTSWKSRRLHESSHGKKWLKKNPYTSICMSESFREVIGVTVGSNTQRKVRQPIRIKTWEDGTTHQQTNMQDDAYSSNKEGRNRGCVVGN